MINVRVSYESRKELDAVIQSISSAFDILKIKHTEKGGFKKAYIQLEIKKAT